MTLRAKWLEWRLAANNGVAGITFAAKLICYEWDHIGTSQYLRRENYRRKLYVFMGIPGFGETFEVSSI